MRMNLYELRVNGARVGTDYLNPGQLSYDKKRALYRAFDLTGLLNEGANAIGLLFASHKVSIQVLMEYKDGRIEVLPTGEGWQKSNRPGAFVRLWDRDVWELGGRNEIYDAREEFTGWDQPGFDVKNWGNPWGVGHPFHGHSDRRCNPLKSMAFSNRKRSPSVPTTVTWWISDIT